MSSNQPIYNVRDGGISVAVFDGQFGKTAVLQKSYLKKDGDPKNKDDWVRSQVNLFLNELPKVQNVVNEICTTAKVEIDASMKKAS